MKPNKRTTGFGIEMPPRKEHVIVYFIQKGLTENEASIFFELQKAGQWNTIRDRPIRNWKSVACDYTWELKQQKKRYRTTYPTP